MTEFFHVGFVYTLALTSLCILPQFATEKFSSQAGCDSAPESAFEELCFDLFTKDFGYTLIGIKPTSTYELPKKYCNKSGEINLYKLKKIFDKSTNFALKILPDGPFCSVELVNKKSLRKLVEKNFVVQSFVRKNFRDERSFYLKMESPNRSIHQVLKVNERIIGYCLGYDETNIEYYLRRIEVGVYLQKYPLVRFHPLPGGKYSDSPNIFTNLNLYYKPLKPSRGFDSLEAEWQWIKRVERDIVEESKPVPPYFVHLPVYICRSGGGSEEARERFKAASRQIAQLFCDKRPSEVLASFSSDVSLIVLQKPHK